MVKENGQRNCLPANTELWEVRFSYPQYFDGSYGGEEFAETTTVHQIYYVLASSRDEALRKSRREISQFKSENKGWAGARCNYTDRGTIEATPVTLDDLVIARDFSDRFEEPLELVQLIKGEKYRLGIAVYKK